MFLRRCHRPLRLCPWHTFYMVSCHTHAERAPHTPQRSSHCSSPSATARSPVVLRKCVGYKDKAGGVGSTARTTRKHTNNAKHTRQESNSHGASVCSAAARRRRCGKVATLQARGRVQHRRHLSSRASRSMRYPILVSIWGLCIPPGCPQHLPPDLTAGPLTAQRRAPTFPDGAATVTYIPQFSGGSNITPFPEQDVSPDDRVFWGAWPEGVCLCRRWWCCRIFCWPSQPVRLCCEICAQHAGCIAVCAPVTQICGQGRGCILFVASSTATHPFMLPYWVSSTWSSHPTSG